MENFSGKLTKCIALLSLFIVISQAINCYDCSSEHDRRCLSHDDSYGIGRVDCSIAMPPKEFKKNNFTLCKTHTMELPSGPKKIIRSCAIFPVRNNNTNDCIVHIVGGIKSTICTCDTDYCNANYNFEQRV